MSNPRMETLTSNHISFGGEQVDDNLQILLLNNSQETKTLRGHIWALKSQVLLMFICNILLNLMYIASVQI